MTDVLLTNGGEEPEVQRLMDGAATLRQMIEQCEQKLAQRKRVMPLDNIAKVLKNSKAAAETLSLSARKNENDINTLLSEQEQRDKQPSGDKGVPGRMYEPPAQVYSIPPDTPRTGLANITADLNRIKADSELLASRTVQNEDDITGLVNASAPRGGQEGCTPRTGLDNIAADLNRIKVDTELLASRARQNEDDIRSMLAEGTPATAVTQLPLGGAGPAAQVSTIGARMDQDGNAYVQVPGSGTENVVGSIAWPGSGAWRELSAAPRHGGGIWELGPIQPDLAPEVLVVVDGAQYTCNVKDALAAGTVRPKRNMPENPPAQNMPQAPP